MGIDKDKEKILQAFIKSTPSRISNSGAGQPSMLTDKLLSQIELNMQTGIMQKYVYNAMGIIKGTWDGWGKKGRGLIDRIRHYELTYEQTTEQEKRYIYFAFIVETAKSKAIQNEWSNMKRLAKKGSFKASQFILQVVGGKEFITQERLEITPAVGTGGTRDEQIEGELAGFMPVDSLEQLEEKPAAVEPKEVPQSEEGDIPL